MRLSQVFNNIYNKKRYLIIFIFLISILCSLIFLSFFRDIGPSQHKIPGSDYIYLYEPVANNILQGKGITLEGRVPLNIGLGYPVILSGIFGLSQLIGIDKLDLIVIFNVVLIGISAVFLFLLAWKIFNKKIALIASLLWISYPFNLWFIKNPNTEVPFILLLFAGLWLYALALYPPRSKSPEATVTSNGVKFAFLAGLILGLASFVRIIGLFLPLFLASLIFFFLKGAPKRRKLLLAIILLMGNFVALLPWGIITFSETGGFVPLSTQGPESIVVGITWLSSPGATTVLSDDVAALVERAEAEDLSSFFKLSQFFGQELKNNPLPFLKLIGLKLVRPWYATSSRWYEGQILAVQLLYLITALGGLLYLIKTAKNKIRNIIFLLSPVFYFWGMAFINASILRYLVPVMGLIMIFSAITVNFVIKKLVRKIRPQLL